MLCNKKSVALSILELNKHMYLGVSSLERKGAVSVCCCPGPFQVQTGRSIKRLLEASFRVGVLESAMEAFALKAEKLGHSQDSDATG